MNYFRIFYYAINSIINPNPPFKSIYSSNYQNKLLFKNAIMKPVYKDEFNNFNYIKYKPIIPKVDDFKTNKEELV